MPRLTGTRSPRLLARPLWPRLADVPPLLATLALDPRAAARSAATVLRPTVPLAVRRAARWKRLTARTVVGPNWPSTLTEKPARRRAFCNSRTSCPLAPARSARSPRWAPVERLAIADGAANAPRHRA